MTQLKVRLGLLRKKLITLSQSTYAYLESTRANRISMMLFAFGITVLALGMHDHSIAQGLADGVSLEDHTLVYTDDRIAEAVVGLFTMIEGSFGALVMVCAGIAAILGSAFGQYRAALGCLVVAVGSFILRSFAETFFNMQSIHGAGEP